MNRKTRAKITIMYRVMFRKSQNYWLSYLENELEKLENDKAAFELMIASSKDDNP